MPKLNAGKVWFPPSLVSISQEYQKINSLSLYTSFYHKELPMDISSAVLDPEPGCVAFTVERGNEKDRPSVSVELIRARRENEERAAAAARE